MGDFPVVTFRLRDREEQLTRDVVELLQFVGVPVVPVTLLGDTVLAVDNAEWLDAVEAVTTARAQEARNEDHDVVDDFLFRRTARLQPEVVAEEE